MDQNHFKMRLCRIFRSSLACCKSKNLNHDVIAHDTTDSFVSKKTQAHPGYCLVDLFARNPRPLSSTCRPKCPHNIHTNESLHEDRKCLLISPEVEGRKCRPVSPISEFQEFPSGKSKKSSNKKKVRSSTKKKSDVSEFREYRYNGLFNDTNKEVLERDYSYTTKMCGVANEYSTSKSHGCGPRRPRGSRAIPEAGLVPLQQGVKDSLAVVKRSSDPYSDFRTSMVEMIVEKQIFTARELENLLHCFLSLNSYHHHRVIIQVFSEIWEALFMTHV